MALQCKCTTDIFFSMKRSFLLLQFPFHIGKRSIRWKGCRFQLLFRAGTKARCYPSTQNYSFFSFFFFLLAIFFIFKITLCPLNNILIVDYFQDNVIITNFFTTSIQTIEVQIITSSHLSSPFT